MCSVEMRHSVTTLSYRSRRIVDRVLSHVFPPPLPTKSRLKLTPAATAHPKTASIGPTVGCGATGPLSSHLSRDYYLGGWISLYTMVRETSVLPFSIIWCACWLFYYFSFFYFSLQLSHQHIVSLFSFSFISLPGRSPLAYRPARRPFGISLAPQKGLRVIRVASLCHEPRRPLDSPGGLLGHSGRRVAPERRTPSEENLMIALASYLFSLYERGSRFILFSTVHLDVLIDRF